jgi:hypothetical protein
MDKIPSVWMVVLDVLETMRLMDPCETQLRPGTRAVRLGTVNNFLATPCHSLIHP